MHHWRVSAGDSYLRKARRERAGGNFRCSADRRARASDYLAARVIRAHDEAKPLRDIRQMPGTIFGDAHDEERTARCGTITRRPRLRRRVRKFLECSRMRMPEGETKADRQSAVV